MTKKEIIRKKANRKLSMGKKVRILGMRTWSDRQLKKARWKKSLARAEKSGTVYGGYVRLTDEWVIFK